MNYLKVVMALELLVLKIMVDRIGVPCQSFMDMLVSLLLFYFLSMVFIFTCKFQIILNFTEMKVGSLSFFSESSNNIGSFRIWLSFYIV